MTALAKQHETAGAVMDEEGGLAVPLHYGSPLSEIHEIKTHAGIFDVSHIGRIRIRGSGAMSLLKRVCTADVVRQEDDTALMTLICNENGGILDICCLLRLENFWMLTCSPGNNAGIIEHLARQDIPDVKIDDQTSSTTQFSIVGPGAEAILDAQLPVNIAGMARGAAKSGSMMIARYTAARVGPTSGWILEVTLPNMFATKAWNYITVKAGDAAMTPCGMAAREILRLEAGLPRWGHELNRTIDPITAGLSHLVDTGRDFLGAGAISEAAAGTPPRRRVSLEIEPSDQCGIPGLGTAISTPEGREAGAITSAALDTSKNILAMAYIDTSATEENGQYLVNSEPEALKARITKIHI